MVAKAGNNRVLVVDDDAAFRDFVVTLLDRVGCVTREAARGDDALDILAEFEPDLVLLDVNLPGVTGYEVCHELRRRFGSACAVLFLSGMRVEALDRVAGLLIGADDYIVKPCDSDELVARVRAQLRRIDGGVRGPRPAADGSARLTERESEVLTQLAWGRTQTEIAAELVISPKTVATHIQRVLAKLGVHSRAQAVALAHREQLVPDFQAQLALEPPELV
jgi:two-component system nitrate/nitrite response regulator NarL